MSDELTAAFRANPLRLICWVWQRSIAEQLINAGMDEAKAFGLAINLERKARYIDSVCWDWRGPLSPSGHGVAFDWPAHYAVAHFLKAPIADHSPVVHSCGERTCCNPEHMLYLRDDTRFQFRHESADK